MSKNSGIVALDFLYVFALLGTMLGGVFFAIGDRMHYLSHYHMYVLFDFFPALFLFLNGMTLSILLRDKRVSSRRTIGYNSKKGLVLLLLGIAFAKAMPLNLFFISGFVYLMAGSVVQWNNTILRLLAVFIAVATLLLLNLDVPSSPYMKILTMQGTGWKQLVAFFVFNGYYSILPWSIFFVMGLLHGRSDLRPKGWLPPTSILAGILIVAALVLEAYCAMIYSFDHTSAISIPFVNVKLFTPAFVLFESAMCIIFVNLMVYLLRKVEIGRFTKQVQFLSATKYTIYFFLLVFALIIYVVFNKLLFRETVVIVLSSFALVSLSVFLTYWWSKKISEKTPMQWLIKRVAGSTKN
jgi:hypothetical protein